MDRRKAIAQAKALVSQMTLDEKADTMMLA